MRVLIIDPAPFQRRILALLLEARGPFDDGLFGGGDPTGAIEGFGAVEEVISPPASTDLVFCEAALLVAGIPAPLARATVIVTGPEKADAMLAEALARGASAFLAKPYTEAGLGRALDDLALRRDAPALKKSAARAATGETRP